MFEMNSRQCPLGAASYTIKAGDTLYSLAQVYKTSVEILLSLNPGINPYLLRIGQRICIPVRPNIPLCSNGYNYTIRRGDTFYGISQLTGIPLNTLIRANPGINPNNLAIGQVVCIPTVPGTLQLVRRIPVFVEGMTDYRDARLFRSDQGYYIYVLDNFTFTGEEPGSDLLFSNFDDRFDARIQMYPRIADISQLRQNSIMELQTVGTPIEMKKEEIFDPFFQRSVFFLIASNSTLSKIIILIDIDGALFRFTLNAPNAEAAEGLIPSLYAMLKTITIR